MDIISLVGGVIGGAISASGLTIFFAKSIKERWLESVKAAYAVELESIKAKLDQGNYVTKAQYDLELNSYKDLWIALADLRTVAGSVVGVDFFYSRDTNPTGRKDAKHRAMQALRDAHNKAVQTVDHMAPFYDKEIQNKSRAVVHNSNTMVQHARDWAEDESALHWQVVESEIKKLGEIIEGLDAMIRDRLNSLRVIR